MMLGPAGLRGRLAGDDDGRLDARHADQPDRACADGHHAHHPEHADPRLARVAADQPGPARPRSRSSCPPGASSTGPRTRRPVPSRPCGCATTSPRPGQYPRNAAGRRLAWLGIIDNTLTSVTDQTRRARDLALQGANAGSRSAQVSATASPARVDELRESLLADANTTYLGRPVFGGITAGGVAYDASGSLRRHEHAGDPHRGRRRHHPGGRGRPPRSSVPPATTSSTHLADLSTALRAGDQAGIQAGDRPHGQRPGPARHGARRASGTRAARVDAGRPDGARTPSCA